MVPFVARKWLLAASVTAALAAAPAFAAKDVVVAVGSNFTTLDPYDANDTHTSHVKIEYSLLCSIQENIHSFYVLDSQNSNSFVGFQEYR